ncbi:ArsR/SmtB family transcription factor [Saccharomonospora azurea]
MTDGSSLDDLRVLAHPVRLRILSLLTGVAMSAAEIARELGETQANVSYHLRRLHAAGLLDVEAEVRIRGGRAKRYRHCPESGPDFTERTRDEERVFITAMARELHRRSDALDTSERGSLTDAELWVDEQTWRRAVEKAHEIAKELHDAAKAPRAPGTRHVNATVALFPMADQ